MVANTHERQEALVKATMHGKKFFITKGKHINSNDMFISAEMGNRERETAEMEKGKKVRIEFHARRDASFIVLELYISSLPATEEMTIWATLLDGQRQTRPI
jgi:hypothetical protein